jgi:hypothetical protein
MIPKTKIRRVTTRSSMKKILKIPENSTDPDMIRIRKHVIESTP